MQNTSYYFVYILKVSNGLIMTYLIEYCHYVNFPFLSRYFIIMESALSDETSNHNKRNCMGTFMEVASWVVLRILFK